MPRGGARPGSGPSKGTKYAKKEARKRLPADITRAAKVNRMTPLEYMLMVMCDEAAEPARRDRMAQAAAPFVHAKPLAKPEQDDPATATAKAAQDSGWDSLLPN